MPPNYRTTQVNLTVLTARRHVMESETKHNATALTPPTASTNDNRKMKNYMYMIGNHTPTKTIKSQSTLDAKALELLPVASDQDVTSAPTTPTNDPIVVNAYCQMKKVRGLDAKHSSVDGSFVLYLAWVNELCIGKKITDVSQLWVPQITVLNRDRLTVQTQGPYFYPETGQVKMELYYDGSFSNEADLRHFPFDMDSVSLLFVAERGTEDHLVRLVWKNHPTKYSAYSITPDYIARQMQEWKFFPLLNSVRRMQQQKGTSGDATGIEIRIYLARRFQFYIYKIAMVLYMITMLSWFVFAFDVDTGVVDTEALVNRLRYAASLLLASVSFLYISADSIPKLAYLTTLDQMILYGFLNLFFVMLETFVVFRMTKSGVNPDTIMWVDTIAGWFLPLMYLGNQMYVVCSAFRARTKCYNLAVSQHTGIEPALLETTKNEMKRRRWWFQQDLALFSEANDKLVSI